MPADMKIRAVFYTWKSKESARRFDVVNKPLCGLLIVTEPIYFTFRMDGCSIDELRERALRLMEDRTRFLILDDVEDGTLSREELLI